MLFLTGCHQATTSLDKSEQLKTDVYSEYLFTLQKIDSRSVLDSIKALTTSSMQDTANYKRKPKANLFINEAGHTWYQVFENPKGTIAVIAYFRENQEINVAEYYKNGQAVCLFSVSEEGMRNGPYQCFYENGTPRIKGFYQNDNEVLDSTKQFEE